MADTDTRTQAPASYPEFLSQLGRGWVEQIERAQELQVELIGRFREAAQQWLPNLPSFQPPQLEGLPSPQTIARANYELAGQVLAAQKQYALGILESLAPKSDTTESN